MPLSNIYSIDDVDDYEWIFPDMTGLQFEDYIFSYLRRFISDYFEKGARVCQTKHTNDGGKDIIITSPCNIFGLFGIDFFLQGRKSIKIYIECKSSKKYKIPYNGLSGNVERVRDDKIDYYIAVTNTTVAPFTFYKLQTTFEQYGIKFILVDNNILGEIMSKTDNNIKPKYIDVANTHKFRAYYQLEKNWNDGEVFFHCILL